MADKKLDELVTFVKDHVQPNRRQDVSINVQHRTMLNGCKSKKQVTHKKVKKNQKPSKTLSRKQFANLGLFTLPTKSIKYEELMPLHEMWLVYIRRQLKPVLIEENGCTRIPAVHEPGYESFSKAVVKTDLHGALIKVTASKCPSLVGHTGIVAMETKNSFKIVGQDNRTRSKRVSKLFLLNYLLFCSYIFNIFL